MSVWMSGYLVSDISLSLPLSPPHAHLLLGRESVDVIDEENQHSRLSLSHYLEEKSRRSLVEELCSAYELSATSVDLLPSLYKRIEREEQTAAMTSVMKVEKEGNISRYYYLADIEATSVHHSYQQHIRLFTWTKMTSLRWVLPRRTTATTTPARDTTSAEREGLEFLDFSTLTSLLQENNLDKLYGRKVMYLSLQRALFCSDDFHKRPFPMFFNIEAIATSVQRCGGGGGSASGGWEYVFKPAYFHFADVSQSTSLDELIAVLSKYQSDVSDKEVIKALTDARLGQREGNDVTTGVKRRARASSSAFQSQLSSLDLTHRVHMSYQEFHQQQSQLSSQMILYSISPLRERDLAKPANLLPPLPLPQREEEEEREARLILPVIAYDVTLAELFQGITANLIALAIYRKQQQQEEEKNTSLPPSLPYDDICYDAINTLQQTSESEHNYLVIVRFIQSCDDEEAMTCTNIDELFAESYPSDVTPSHSTHRQQSSVIAILERLVL